MMIAPKVDEDKPKRVTPDKLKAGDQFKVARTLVAVVSVRCSKREQGCTVTVEVPDKGKARLFYRQGMKVELWQGDKK
jgi:hypothetical protein